MEKKVQQLFSRLSEVESLLGQPGILNDQKQYRQLTQEHAYLSEVRDVRHQIDEAKKQQQENLILLKEERDLSFAELLREDSAQLEKSLEILENRLEELLIPPDPSDSKNIIMELRAGTGGDEAALFVADCVRMYKLFADSQGWRCEQLSCMPSEKGGFKEYIMSVTGHNVYRIMRYEGGTHRVQRVPETEAQGRVHTSAITVAVLPEPDKDEEIEIVEKDLRIDTYRSSGAGGQHVNVTDSAVRLTHIPTGTVVQCQDERSQHKNKEKALRLLAAKLLEHKRGEVDKLRADDRATQVGSGDRSERIRTYNFPQNRITDHRIGLTLHNLDRAMQGSLGILTSALVKHYHEKKLAGQE